MSLRIFRGFSRHSAINSASHRSRGIVGCDALEMRANQGLAVRFPRAPPSCTTIVLRAHLCPCIGHFFNFNLPPFTTVAGDVPMFYG